MKLSLLALVAAIGVPFSGSAAGLSGGWIVKANVAPRVKYTLLCALKADGDRFEGPCSGVTGLVSRAAGRMDDRRIWFGYDTDYNGSGLHLDYRGDSQPGGVFKGKVESRLSSGVFVAAPVDGAPNAWKVDVAFEGLKYTVVCVFKENGSKISGPCAVTDGSTLETAGSAEGATVTMAYDTTYQGQPVHVDYKGKLTSDSAMSGDIVAGAASGVFTATKP